MTDQINDAVRATAMLVSFYTTAWHGKIKDYEAAKAAAKALGIDENSVDANRNLMIGNDANLIAVRTAQEYGRNIHKHLTLPWSADNRQRGPRMLPTSSWLSYMQQIAEANAKFSSALTRLVETYDEDKARAQARIDMVGDPLRLYPDASELKGLFTIKLDFTPIPAGAHFQNLPPQAQGVLEESYENKFRSRIELAMQDAYVRTRDAVKNLAERLAAETPTFKTAAVENVRELPPLLRAWNLGNSENLDTLASDVEKLVAGEDMKSLKANEAVRKLVAKEAARIVEMIDGWGVIKESEEE